jgi:N-glycosylase/DNA lyase
MYERVGDIFRSRFGSHAGWAHSVLFAAELAEFQSFLPSSMVQDMQAFRRAEKAEKAESTSGKRKAAAAVIDEAEVDVEVAIAATSTTTRITSSRRTKVRTVDSDESEEKTAATTSVVRTRQSRRKA